MCLFEPKGWWDWVKQKFPSTILSLKRKELDNWEGPYTHISEKSWKRQKGTFMKSTSKLDESNKVEKCLKDIRFSDILVNNDDNQGRKSEKKKLDLSVSRDRQQMVNKSILCRCFFEFCFLLWRKAIKKIKKETCSLFLYLHFAF